SVSRAEKQCRSQHERLDESLPGTHGGCPPRQFGKWLREKGLGCRQRWRLTNCDGDSQHKLFCLSPRRSNGEKRSPPLPGPSPAPFVPETQPLVSIHFPCRRTPAYRAYRSPSPAAVTRNSPDETAEPPPPVARRLVCRCRRP